MISSDVHLTNSSGTETILTVSVKQGNKWGEAMRGLQGTAAGYCAAATWRSRWLMVLDRFMYLPPR